LVQTVESVKPSWLKRRRAEHLRREIALLERMDSRLWHTTLLCGALTIAGIAAAVFALGVAVHIHIGLGLAICACLTVAALIFWASRYEYGLLWMFATILIGIVLIFIFQEIPFFETITFDDPNLDRKVSHKEQRRNRINRAISKLKMKLEKTARDLT
jgi:uncharacterized membrane protein YccC